MLLLGRGVEIFVIICLVSSVAPLRQFGTPGNSLYVAKDPDKSDRKLTVIERHDDNESRIIGRSKRDADAIVPSPVINKNASTWVSIITVDFTLVFTAPLCFLHLPVYRTYTYFTFVSLCTFYSYWNNVVIFLSYFL